MRQISQGKIDHSIDIKMKIEELKNLNLEILKKREMEKILIGEESQETEMDIQKIDYRKKKMMNFLKIEEDLRKKIWRQKKEEIKIAKEIPSYLSMFPQKKESVWTWINKNQEKEDNTNQNKNNKNLELEECFISVKNVQYNLINVRNLLKDNFEFITSKSLVDEKKIAIRRTIGRRRKIMNGQKI